MRKRIALIAYVDIDRVSGGAFRSADSAVDGVRYILDGVIGHYDPFVMLAPAEAITQTERRAGILIYVDLDLFPGEFHTTDSARNVVGHILQARIGHYNPLVSVAPAIFLLRKQDALLMELPLVESRPLAQTLLDLNITVELPLVEPAPTNLKPLAQTINPSNIDFNIIKGYN